MAIMVAQATVTITTIILVTVMVTATGITILVRRVTATIIEVMVTDGIARTMTISSLILAVND
jgi:hypothetical protein